MQVSADGKAQSTCHGQLNVNLNLRSGCGGGMRINTVNHSDLLLKFQLS